MRVYRKLLLVFSFIFFAVIGKAQLNKDSIVIKNDSLHAAQDTALKLIKYHTATLDEFLKKNKYLNASQNAVSLANNERTNSGKEFLFYILCTTLLLMALFKVFYSRYFNNIFRVFFNTSLRQNQLTDLLLQAKLPSLIFNIFFILSTGFYVWLLLNHLLKENNEYIFLMFTIISIALIYFGKFIFLKIMGWISGMSSATDQYIFVIFLVNKILGIFLLPFIILLAFAPQNWRQVLIISSLLVIGILFIMRYLRSYGLLQHQIKINGFHFLLYIIGAEVLPILLIYKFSTQLLLNDWHF